MKKALKTTVKETIVEAMSMNKMVALAKAKGYFKSGRYTTTCTKCGIEAVVFKKGRDSIFACTCGWRYATIVKWEPVDTPTPPPAKKAKAKAKPKTKAKEMGHAPAPTPPAGDSFPM